MKIAFHTLGCKVNQYESEAMAQSFRQRGHDIVGERDFADVYVINTCTVTAVADRKSRQYIRRMKKLNPDSIVAVTGCYAQIDPEAVTGIQGVDIVTGTNEKSTLPEYVEVFAAERREKAANDGSAAEDEKGKGKEREEAVHGGGDDRVLNSNVHIHDWKDLDSYESTGLVTSAENRTRAYIKIQEGCNRFCSYCVIPYARGSVRSRNLQEIIREARQLIAAGYKEIILTGINTALYGMEAFAGSRSGIRGMADSPDPGQSREEAGQIDRTAADRIDRSDGEAGGRPDDAPWGVEEVIAALNRLPGNFRIRLSSLEPAVVNADYVKRLLKYDKLCHHLHLSAQSGSDRVLAAMNRPYDRQTYMEIVDTLRRFDPYYGISTDLIVGFPGEQERDAADSLRLVEDCDFCRTHVFRYSRRPKTLAASMKNQVSPQVKARRSDALQAAGDKARSRFCERNLGQERIVLLEEYLPEEEYLTGYTDNYIRVYLPWDAKAGPDMVNTFRQVRLTRTFRDGCLGLIL